MNFRRSAAAFLVTALLPSFAIAASEPTIKVASPGVVVGKAGSWKPATPGMAIATTDFVKIPEKASATIVLPDSTAKEFNGRTIIPGRRLVAGGNAAGAMIYFSQGLQKTAEAIAGPATGTTKSSGITRSDDMSKKGLHVHVKYEGIASDIESHLGKGEAAFDDGNYVEARKAADETLANVSAEPLQKRRAHLLKGQVLAAEANYDAAVPELDQAARPGGDDDFAQVRAIALIQRGQVETQLGDDPKAKHDFEAAIDNAGSNKAIAVEAKFLLGVLAVTAKDEKSARGWFDQVQDVPELYKAGMAMLEKK